MTRALSIFLLLAGLAWGQTAPSLTLSTSPNPSTYGQAVTLTATGPGIPPNSTITFVDGSTAIGSGTTNANSTATFTTSSLAVGTHPLQAIYTAPTGAPIRSNVVNQVVNKAPPNLALSSSPNPSTVGQTVTLIATAANGASGSVTFLDGSTVLGSNNLTNGTASFQVSNLSAGDHILTASYPGDGNFAASQSKAITQTVTKLSTRTTLSVSPNPANTGQPVTLTASVTPSGATGTVTFFDGATSLSTASLSGGTASFITSSLATGQHSLTAAYNGDANYNAGNSAPVSLTVNQAAAATTTSLASTPNPSAVGQSVTLTATVSPSDATGTVTFRDGGNSLGTSNLSGGGASFAASNLAAGSHTLTAVYSGDASHGSSTSGAVIQVVNKTATSTSLTASPNPAAPGQSVILTATVTPASATGSVTFNDGSTSIGTATVSGGAASITTSSLTIGPHSLTAIYGGDATFGGSTSPPVSLVVSKAASTTTLSASLGSASVGQPVTLTATVTPAGATGSVTFNDGSTPIGTAQLNGGTALLNTSTLPAGNHSITATYSGDGNYSSSTSSPVTVTVSKQATTTTLSASPTAATPGQPVVLTATVSPAGATGSVIFNDGTNLIGTAPLTGGTATLTASALVSGSHSITAVYSGDGTFNGSTSSPAGVAVGQGNTSTTLTVSPSPGVSGQPVTLTAVVVPNNATGSVTFKDGNSVLAAVSLVNGTAAFTTSSLSAGTHSLTAAYSGDTAFNVSTSAPFSEVVNQAVSPTQTFLSVAPNPGVQGQPVTLNSVVSPNTATGTVTFKDGGTVIGTATLSNGSATLSTSSLTAGTHTLTASYSGDTADSPSTSDNFTYTVNSPNVTVALTASPNPANYGQTVTLTVTVTPSTSTGTVTFLDGSTTLGTAALNSGTAVFTTSTLKVGTHSLQATYNGQSGSATVTINPAPTTTALTASSNFTLTATVSPAAASGTVTFRDGSTTLGTATLNNGTATLSAGNLSPGTHTLTATYNGDGNYVPSTSNIVTVNPSLPATTTTLAVSPTSSAPGQTVTLTATVNPSSATGTVTFLDGATTLGTATLNAGTAAFTTSTLASGTHMLMASYGGDSKNGPSTSSPVTETVGLPVPLVVITASPNPSIAGQSVTLTATVTSSTPSGTVTFLDGSVTLGTAALTGGSATLMVSTLTAGSHTLTASYGGDTNNAPATSAAITQAVNTGTTLVVSPVTIPTAFVGTTYSQTFTVSGATPPVTWSLVSGTQELTMTPAGVLSGTPRTAGTFQLTVRVQDSLGQSGTAALTWTVNPAVPSVTIMVTQPTSIADQPAAQVSLAPAYPVALNGTYRLTFTPNAAGLPSNFTNSAVQFVTGGTTSAPVAIPANSTAPVNLPAVQLGTVAGTITVQLASLTMAGTGEAVPLPSPAPSATITVPRLAPVIVPGSVKITSITSSGFQVVLDASSTPRDLASAILTFTSASGTSLNGTQFTVSLASAAAAWFDPANAAGVSNGGAFSLTIPFTFSGDTSSIGTVSVTLSNSVGASSAQSGGR